MTNQEKWIAFCEAYEEEICIYDKPFWLDTVCYGRQNWDVFLVERDDEIQAALPYYIKKRMGLRYITMPQLTQHNGIWMKTIANETTESRIKRENELYALLIDQIEEAKISVYQQCFASEVTNWQPFERMGYRQSTLYTFFIDFPYGLAEVKPNFSKSVKQNIRKANQAGTIEEFDDTALFYQVQCMTYTRKNMRNPISESLTERLYKACKEHDAVKMLCAKDNREDVCAVLFLVYDAKNVYSLMGGMVPDKRCHNFLTALDYEGIKFACETGRAYDFEGSMLEGVANYNRAFGAEMRPYFTIKKIFEKRPFLRQYLKYKLYV